MEKDNLENLEESLRHDLSHHDLQTWTLYEVERLPQLRAAILPGNDGTIDTLVFVPQGTLVTSLPNGLFFVQGIVAARIEGLAQSATESPTKVVELKIEIFGDHKSPIYERTLSPTHLIIPFAYGNEEHTKPTKWYQRFFRGHESQQ